MSDIARIVGQRIRARRNRLGWSQEKMAELSGCRATYIGQLERGEKNATLESIERIARALQLPLSVLFEKLGGAENAEENIPLACYEYLSTKTPHEQEQPYQMLIAVDKYKQI